jgi:hypothetical protein
MDPLTGRPYKRSDVKKAYVTVTEPVTVRVLPLFDGSGCAKPCTSPVYAASKRRLPIAFVRYSRDGFAAHHVLVARIFNQLADMLYLPRL